jgi:hypothetical protein
MPVMVVPVTVPLQVVLAIVKYVGLVPVKLMPKPVPGPFPVLVIVRFVLVAGELVDTLPKL